MKGIVFKSLNFGDVVQAAEMGYWQSTGRRAPKQPLKHGAKIVILTKVSVCPLKDQQVTIGRFNGKRRKKTKWVSTQTVGAKYSENGFVLNDAKLVAFADLSKSIQKQIREMPPIRSWVYLK